MTLSSKLLRVFCLYCRKKYVFRHWKLIAVGVAALQEFVRLNWTQSLKLEDVEPFEVHPQLLHQVLIDEIDGESLETVTKRPQLLLLAKVLLFDSNNAFDDHWVVRWWRFRVVSIHVKVITQHSSLLHHTGSELIKGLDSYNLPERIYEARLAVEASLFYSHYFESSEAEAWMNRAAKLAGIEVKGKV